jgi:hypothetical protein
MAREMNWDDDRRRRFWLVFAGVMWAIIGIGYLGIGNARRWAPDVVGIVCFICTILFLTFAAKPSLTWAYRFAGTAAVGSLLLHITSVALGLIRAEDPETIWVILIWSGVAAMLLRLFWAWWLGPIKVWHEDHLREKRRDLR